MAVQDVEPGPAECVYMDSDRTITIDVAEHIPLGHKVALEKLAEGVDVVEYGVRIGLTRNAIEAGHWAHTHNLRSARWQTSV
ncbi:MAG: hypothetical protein ACRD0J_01070 [Acidimicrobiales bacterium]